MKYITAGTIARTICLAVALLNQVLAAAGKSPLPIEDETINMLVSTGATVIAAAVAWWKNNSFTSVAVQADKVLKELKEGDDI